MKTKTKILISFVFIVVIIILVNLYGPNEFDVKRLAYGSLKFQVFNSIVSDKYYDKENHDYPTINIKNIMGQQIVYLPLDKSGLFMFLDVNDSISKEYGTYNVKVFRKNIKHLFTLDYGVCGTK